MTDIYAASEDPIPGISGKMLAETIQRTTGQDVSYMSGFESIKTTFVDHVAAGDLVMTIWCRQYQSMLGLARKHRKES